MDCRRFTAGGADGDRLHTVGVLEVRGRSGGEQRPGQRGYAYLSHRLSVVGELARAGARHGRAPGTGAGNENV